MNELTFHSVTLIYHTKREETVAVKDLSFSVETGEFAATIGPSGCGKSTILSMAAGLLSPTKGEVVRTGKRVGYMLQRDELFPWRTVEKNILLPLEIQKNQSEEAKERALALAEKYGLKDFLRSYPTELSGGMRQRAALIRTLALSPDLLLLDEPFSALDYQTRLSVASDVHSIIRSEQKTALLITHDIGEAISMADTVMVLSPRPATLKARHSLPFERTLSPLKRRESELFSGWFETLWEELHV